MKKTFKVRVEITQEEILDKAKGILQSESDSFVSEFIEEFLPDEDEAEQSFVPENLEEEQEFEEFISRMGNKRKGL